MQKTLTNYFKMKYIFLIFFLGFVFANCRQDLEITVIDPAVQYSIDVALIDNYLADSLLVADTTTTGIRYIIEDTGISGAIIEPSDTINLLLKGYFLDGSVFTETADCSPITISLPEMIPGLREGLRQFNTWGKGKLFIPSYLAFGESGSSNIPVNAILAFDVEIVAQKEFDNSKIKTYISENNLTDIDSTDSGIYYKLTEVGTGNHPDANATVTITYTGYFADSTTFELSETPMSFGLEDVIKGWKEAIPLLKKDGAGTFLIPSELAYGAAGSGSIGPNTMIIFDITLVDFTE